MASESPIPTSALCVKGKSERGRQRNKQRGVIDDGFHPEFVEGAVFDGILGIPVIPPPKNIIVPTGLVPWSKASYAENPGDFGCFYEHDIVFRDVIIDFDSQENILRSRPGWISPDCSLYRNMPLALQIANVYMNRAIGFQMVKRGHYVVTNIRWGDERTYTNVVLPEPVAFLGAPKNSIVSIGTYGCAQGKRNQRYLREGLEAMLGYLSPQVVLVYGPMSPFVFDGLKSRTEFVGYPDWTARMHGRG